MASLVGTKLFLDGFLPNFVASGLSLGWVVDNRMESEEVILEPRLSRVAKSFCCFEKGGFVT